MEKSKGHTWHKKIGQKGQPSPLTTKLQALSPFLSGLAMCFRRREAGKPTPCLCEGQRETDSSSQASWSMGTQSPSSLARLLTAHQTRRQTGRPRDLPVKGHSQHADPDELTQGSTAPTPGRQQSPQTDLLAASSSVPVSSTLLRLCSACVSSGTSSSPSACRTDSR